MFLTWSRNAARGEVTDLASPGPVDWLSGVWKHLAFTWRIEDGKTRLALYLDGRKIACRLAPFVLDGKDLPRQWQVGDIPMWNPGSEFKTRLGRTEILEHALSDEEIAAAASREYTASGGLVYVTRELFPGTECEIEGAADTAAAGLRYEWNFSDENGAVVAAPAMKSNFTGDKFRFQFRMPDCAAELRLTVNTTSRQPTDFRIVAAKCSTPGPQLGPYYWQSAWIWGEKPHAEICLRRTFNVDDPAMIERAVFQWATDDGSEVFINGKTIGKVSSWAAPKVRDDLVSLLRRGENVIGVKAYNRDSGAGFIGELMLVKKDGSAEVIPGDTRYRFSSTAATGWLEPGFDDRSWTDALIRCRIGQPPYGATPYRYLGRVWPMTMVRRELPGEVEAGGILKFLAVYRGSKGFPDDRVMLTLRRDGREIAAFPAVMKRNGEDLELSAEVTIPAAAAGIAFEIVPVCTVLQFTPLGTFTVAGGHRISPLAAEVKRINGAPRLVINNRVEPMMLYRTPLNFRNETSAYRFMGGFARAGVTLFEINLPLEQLWNKDGSLNRTFLDDHILAALFHAPQGHLVVFFNVDAPGWYLTRHPETRYYYENGPFNQVSYASELWRRDSERFLTQLIEYIKTRPYYHNIAGFGIDGGEDGQWMQWTGRNLDHLGDYSPSMQKYFHAFLARKYGKIADLNDRYGTSYADFTEVAIPAPAVRARQSPLFFDPLHDWCAIDYNQAFSDAVTDNILAYGRIIKQVTGNHRIVGVYYGKLFSIAGYNDWGEFGTGRIIASPDIDYLIAVEYLQREAGKPHSVSAPMGSYTLHNKIFVDEADLRTFLSGSRNWGYSGGLFDTASMIRKMFILSFAKNHGIHWYDLHGGVFEQPGILAAIRRVRETAEKYRELPPSKADVAVIIDEVSLMHASNDVKKLTGQFMLHQQNGSFGRMGTNFDMYLQSDLNRKDFPAYKMYVFLNAWYLDAAGRDAVDRLKKNGAMLVWLFNAGYSDDRSCSAANIERLTGIKVKLLPSGVPAAMRLAPQSESKLELLRQMPSAFTSLSTTAPIFIPDDVQATGLASLVKAPERQSMAMRDFGNWRSIYAAIPLLPPELWRELARTAGAHIYSDDPDVMLYFGAGLLGVHTGSAGGKPISWPRPADFTDALTGEIIARGVSVLQLPMKKNETRIIRVESR